MKEKLSSELRIEVTPEKKTKTSLVVSFNKKQAPLLDSLSPSISVEQYKAQNAIINSDTLDIVAIDPLAALNKANDSLHIRADNDVLLNLWYNQLLVAIDSALITGDDSKVLELIKKFEIREQNIIEKKQQIEKLEGLNQIDSIDISNNTLDIIPIIAIDSNTITDEEEE